MTLTKGQIMMIQNMVNTELSNKNTVYNPTELVNLKEQLTLYNVVGRIEQLPNITLKQAIAKAKPNLDKITDVDKYLDDIR